MQDNEHEKEGSDTALPEGANPRLIEWYKELAAANDKTLEQYYEQMWRSGHVYVS